MAGRKRVSWATLVPGLLVAGKDASLELVFEPGDDTVKLTADERSDGQTYFNFRPPARLQAIIAPYLQGYKLENPVGLHRAVVAVDGRYVAASEQVHHQDHNHLDNRAENLAPMEASEHQAHHSTPGNERLPDDGHLPFQLNNLHLRITYNQPPRVTGAPGGGDEAREDGQQAPTGRGWTGRAAGSPRGPVNVDGTGVLDGPLVETSFGVPGAGRDTPDHRRRPRHTREIQRFGLSYSAAKRSRHTLDAVRKLGEKATAGQIIRLVTAKKHSERAAYESLAWLVSVGWLEQPQSRVYRLTGDAYVVVRARR